MGARAAAQPFWHQARLPVRQLLHGWFRDDSSAVHLPCISFLLFFHQLHVRSSGIRSQRSELPALEHSPWFLQEETGVATDTGLAGKSGWPDSLSGLAPSWFAQVDSGPAWEGLMNEGVMGCGHVGRFAFMKRTHWWPRGHVLRELADPGAGSSSRVTKAPHGRARVTGDRRLPRTGRPGAILKAEPWMRLPRLFVPHKFIF